MCGFEELDREILEAVCQDYEPFEWVVERITERRCAQNDACTAEISDRLMAYVSERLIEAYLIHAEPPYVTAVEAQSDTVRNSWLYITPRGERYLHNLKTRYTIM